MAKPTSGGAGGSGGRGRATGVVPETYREFATDREMEDYIQTKWDEQMVNATDLSRDALDSYKSRPDINGLLRRQKDNNEFYWYHENSRSPRTTVGEVAAAMDATMRPSTENLILWRGIQNIPDISFGLRNGTLLGTIINDKAFISTATKRSTAEDFASGTSGVVIKLLAKKGTNMAAPDQNFNWAGEQREFILARNSRIRITRVVSSNSGKLELEAEIIQ